MGMNKVMEIVCVGGGGWRWALRTPHHLTLMSQISTHVCKGSYNAVLSSWSKLYQNY